MKLVKTLSLRDPDEPGQCFRCEHRFKTVYKRQMSNQNKRKVLRGKNSDAFHA